MFGPPALHSFSRAARRRSIPRSAYSRVSLGRIRVVRPQVVGAPAERVDAAVTLEPDRITPQQVL